MALGNVQLTPQLVDAVRDAADVVDIASDHTRLAKSGERMAGLCPLHKEKTPSFSVDPAKGLYYCFGCGRGGDAIKLHMELTGDDFPTAIENLAGRYGIPLPAVSGRRRGEVDRQRQIERALSAAQEFFVERLAAAPGARSYLEGRRIPPELVEEFGLGYAPEGWQDLVEGLRGRVPLEALEAAGLVARSERNPDRPYDRFRDRLTFPIRNAAGRLVGFGGRTLGDDRAKYINTAETESFHKGRLLYGLDRARRSVRENGRALLVEGYLDVIGAVASGLDEAVASMGTALTAEQCRQLARYADRVIVGYDGDAAGDRAAHRALPLLLAEGLEVRRALFGEGHDPDSLRLEEGPEAVRRRVDEAADLVLHELRLAVPDDAHGDPQASARAGRAVVELLRPIRDPILRYGYARRAAGLLGMPVDVVLERLGVDRGSVEGAEPDPAEERRAGSASSAVRSVEERVLQLLLDESVPLPGADALPSEDAFLDPVCRNIYRVLLALYDSSGGVRPESDDLIPRLAEEGGVVDRAARLLLEGRAVSGEEELVTQLRRLERRRLQRRARELAAEIDRAQRDGDSERLEELMEQKNRVSRRLHRGEASGSQEPGGR